MGFVLGASPVSERSYDAGGKTVRDVIRSLGYQGYTLAVPGDFIDRGTSRVNDADVRFDGEVKTAAFSGSVYGGAKLEGSSAVAYSNA